MTIEDFMDTVREGASEVDDMTEGEVFVYLGDGVFRRVIAVNVSESLESLVISLADEETPENAI